MTKAEMMVQVKLSLVTVVGLLSSSSISCDSLLRTLENKDNSHSLKKKSIMVQAFILQNAMVNMDFHERF